MNWSEFFKAVAIFCGAGTVVLGIAVFSMFGANLEISNSSKRLLLILFIITVISAALAAGIGG